VPPPPHAGLPVRHRKQGKYAICLQCLQSQLTGEASRVGDQLTLAAIRPLLRRRPRSWRASAPTTVRGRSASCSSTTGSTTRGACVRAAAGRVRTGLLILLSAPCPSHACGPAACRSLCLACRRWASHAGAHFRLVNNITGVTLADYRSGRRMIEDAGCACGRREEEVFG
jgi:hypothetical protein